MPIPAVDVIPNMIRPELLCVAGLFVWLIAAATIDVRTRRIPNVVVGLGIVCGLAVQSLTPHGNGLFAFWWGGLGVVQALLGLLLGLALFMPLYVLRAVGAGDVKLLAMVGVWLGPALLLSTTLLIVLSGGAMALVMMFASGSTRQVLSNLRVMATAGMIGTPSGQPAVLGTPVRSSVRLPYALAITVGTAMQIVWLLVRSGA
jgi:prepilin peptidase CpaA